MDLECNILMSATPVSQQQMVQVIVSSKYLAIAQHGEFVSDVQGNSRGDFLDNIAAEALVSAEEPTLTLIEKVRG
jgi:hypothetical protein